MLDHTWYGTPIRLLPRRTITRLLSERPPMAASEPDGPTMAWAQAFWLRLEVELIIRALLQESH